MCIGITNFLFLGDVAYCFIWSWTQVFTEKIMKGVLVTLYILVHAIYFTILCRPTVLH